MKAKIKNNLARMGFTPEEIEALDSLIDMQKEVMLTQDNDDRAREINKLIRERYSLSAEIALVRQKDERPEEFAEYYNFVEECKKKVKAEAYGMIKEQDVIKDVANNVLTDEEFKKIFS